MESPPGTRLGHMRARLHDVFTGGFLGEACPGHRVILRSGDMVRADVRFADLQPGAVSGDYAFTTVFGAVSVPEPIQPPAGMVSWWPGDGNANDIVDGNHATLSGDATFAPGMVGQGFSLDGAGDFVLVSGDIANLNITGDVTVDLWAKRTILDAAQRTMVVKGAGFSGPLAYWLYFSSHQVIGGFKRPDGSGNFLIGPADVTDTNFHHYAYVRSGNTHKLLMDGVVVVASGAFTGSTGDTSGLPLAIGAIRGAGFTQYFGGVIDEVEVFNRALSDAEIKAIYDAGSAGKRKEAIFNPSNGHYYQAITVPGGINWFDAKAAAESRTFAGLQGHLATVTSQQENDFITENLPFAARQRDWLGGFQPSGSPEPGGNWQWVTGEPFSYTNWAGGEPNDAGNEDGLHFFTDSGQWNDESRGSMRPQGYVVEYGTGQ